MNTQVTFTTTQAHTVLTNFVNAGFTVVTHFDNTLVLQGQHDTDTVFGLAWDFTNGNVATVDHQ